MITGAFTITIATSFKPLWCRWSGPSDLLAFKHTTDCKVSKKNQAACVNAYYSVALLSTIMKCFKGQAMAHINSSLSDNLDPLQFTHHLIKSMTTALTLPLHSSQGKYRWQGLQCLTPIYWSSLRIHHHHLNITNIHTPGPRTHTTLCNWIHDFLIHGPQSVRIGDNAFSTNVCHRWPSQPLIILITLTTVQKKNLSLNSIYNSICRWHNHNAPDLEHWWNGVTCCQANNLCQ